MIILDKLGKRLEVMVRYSVKAKRISIKIKQQSAELILPHERFLNKGRSFLLTKESWIRKKIQQTQNTFVIEANTIPLFGKLYSLNYKENPIKAVLLEDEIITISAPKEKHKEILINFLKEKLLSEVLIIADSLKAKYNLHYISIKINKNKTIWGSCSSKADLAFNIKLAMVPPEILHYVIAHEMCHIIEMNHSKNFWSLVAQIHPNYKQAKLWLKANTTRLGLYLPQA